jgi:transaldolase
VAEAYVAGLEARVAQGQDVSHIASVASFFVSRLDTLVDPLLEERIARGGPAADLAKGALGQVAIASAKLAYQSWGDIFSGGRFKTMAGKGARVQRLLWASTGTKNPAYRDVKYLEALIGPDTVNTVPVETLDAFRDHGIPQATLGHDIPAASGLLVQLATLGIDLDALTQKLEDEGVEKFNQPFDKLMAALAERSSRSSAGES